MNAQEEIIDRLKAGASTLACGDYLASLDDVHRAEIFVDAGCDRLLRKYHKIREIFLASAENWNQTFYAVMFRTMDVTDNRSAYERLAMIVDYSVVMHERQSLKSVEALLLGASGLLDICSDDEYMTSLKREFDYLSKKYNIRPMCRSDWQSVGIRPNNRPLFRLVQLASFLFRKEFVVNSILDCRTAVDVENLFGVDVSSYWTSRCMSDEKPNIPKRMGREKSRLLGINLVAPLQYAYGSYVGNSDLRNRAVSLLEDIPAENNRYTRLWERYGVKARNAFESQALLQIATEYCGRVRCAECPIGVRVVDKGLSDR